VKVLVTGANGFIGSYVTQELLRLDHEVLAFDHHAKAETARPGVEVFLGDVRDDVAVTEAAAHVDGIIHLAAVLGTAETIDNPRPAAHTNLLGSLNIYEAASQYRLPVAYAAVGNAWMRSQGGGTYTITKSAAEDFATMFVKNRGGRINVVRPMNAYGPGQSVAAPFGWSKVRKIMPSFICRALAGLPIEVYGDGSQISDMVSVFDVAHAFVFALEAAADDEIWGFAAEVGPRESHTVNDIARLVALEAGDITGQPVDIVHLPMRRGEVPNAVVAADCSTLEAVGINPDGFVSLADGIAKTVRWYADHEGMAWSRPKVAA
jgi:UDP-glucose 4-epimerase